MSLNPLIPPRWRHSHVVLPLQLLAKAGLSFGDVMASLGKSIEKKRQDKSNAIQTKDAAHQLSMLDANGSDI